MVFRGRRGTAASSWRKAASCNGLTGDLSTQRPCPFFLAINNRLVDDMALGFTDIISTLDFGWRRSLIRFIKFSKSLGIHISIALERKTIDNRIEQKENYWVTR